MIDTQMYTDLNINLIVNLGALLIQIFRKKFIQIFILYLNNIVYKNY